MSDLIDDEVRIDVLMEREILEKYNFRGYTFYEYLLMNKKDPKLYFNKDALSDYALTILDKDVYSRFRANIKLKYYNNYNDNLRVILKSVYNSILKSKATVSFFQRYPLTHMKECGMLCQEYIDNFIPFYEQLSSDNLFNSNKFLIEELDKLVKDLEDFSNRGLSDRWELYSLLREVLLNSLRFKYINRNLILKYYKILYSLDAEYIEEYKKSAMYESECKSHDKLKEKYPEMDDRIYHPLNRLILSINCSNLVLVDSGKLKKIRDIYEERVYADYNSGKINSEHVSSITSCFRVVINKLSFVEPDFNYTPYTPILVYSRLEEQYNRNLTQLLYTRMELIKAIDLALTGFKSFNISTLKERTVEWLTFLLNSHNKPVEERSAPYLSIYLGINKEAYRLKIFTKEEYNLFSEYVTVGDE